MKNLFLRQISTVVALLAGLLQLQSAAAAPKVAKEFVRGQILVKPKANLTEGAVQALFEAHGGKQRGAIRRSDVRILSVTEAEEEQVVQALRRHPNIEYAELDRLLPAEETVTYSESATTWQFTKIAAPAAWNASGASSAEVIVAILDSGVESTHPALAGKLVPGWNVFDNNADTDDVKGHGTAVAGTAAAANHSASCRIMPVRVTDLNGNASYSTLSAGLMYAADHGARIANISFIATDSRTVTQAALYFQSRQGLVTVSSGNYGTFDSAPNNPAVLTVSATDPDDQLVSWSNVGNNLDLAAPGLNLYTPSIGGSYGWHSGTSFAAPMVAGIAALVISANPQLSAQQVQQILLQSADDLGAAGWDANFGAGRVNAYRAVLAAMQTVPASDVTSPTAAITSPVAGSTVSASVDVTVKASDDWAVAKVELYLDGELVGTAAAGSHFAWDTTSAAEGAHVLRTIVYDSSGNPSTPVEIAVKVQNSAAADPAVQITSPADQSTVHGPAGLLVQTASAGLVVRTELYLDHRLVANSKAASPRFRIAARKVKRGTHTLQAVAYGASGQAAPSQAVTVTKGPAR